jgi:endo-1,4-beta-xylanase
MKQLSTRPYGALIMMAALLMLLSSADLCAQLVTNGGFESSPPGDVTATGTKGWLVQVAAGVTPPPVFEIVSDTVQEGSHALKVTVHGVGANQWDIQAVADSIPAKPGATYNFSVWARASGSGATVNFTIGNYSYSEYKAIRPATLSRQWQKFTTQFTVSDNATFIRVPIHFYGAVDTGKSIYIDNLQIAELDAGKKPYSVQAESGTRGSNILMQQDGGITYVDAGTNATNAGNPGDTSRIITYHLVFGDSGSYNLFARVRVNTGGGNFFYGNGFGSKDAAADAEWMAVNGLATAGFSNGSDFVDGPGTAGNGVWKWVNLTRNAFSGEQGTPFYVHIDSLSKTFQIGAGNQGLDIDKFAFGKTNLFFSVNRLDNGTVGVVDTNTLYRGSALTAGQSKFLGCAYELPDNVFTRYWTQLTPGNAGKWGTVAGSADTSQWNWNGLDAAYNFARNNHLLFKDHCLIWGQQQPSWISSLDSATQAGHIETWIRKVGQRYPGMDMIDVVNEPLSGHNPPDGGSGRANYKKALGGNGTTGWDWVIRAFTLARQYLPNVKLLLNDYGIINDNTATTSYLQVINLLKDRGLIDGIGVQGHRFELESADTAVMRSNLDRLAATGLPIYITEFDLGNLSNYGTPNDNQQLQFYQKIFPIVWRHPGVKGITLWGYVESQMWQSSCYIVRADSTGRPAFFWMAQYVKDNPVSVSESPSMLPAEFELGQNYPNPFNPATVVSSQLSVVSDVRLVIYDVLGREVSVLVNERRSAGTYRDVFDGTGLASGVYFYRLQAGNFVQTRKMILVK